MYCRYCQMRGGEFHYADSPECWEAYQAGLESFYFDTDNDWRHDRLVVFKRNCRLCGVEFIVRSRRPLYCGPCRREAARLRTHKPKSKLVCQFCQNEFSARTDAKFCSPKCKQAAFRRVPAAMEA